MTRHRKSHDATALERSVSEIVAWATRNDVYHETMRRAGCDLPRGQLWMLTRLASCGPARAGELAGTLGIERSTLSPQIQRLERAGLVARMPDPTDGRAALLQVTRKARALLRRLERSRGDILTEILSDWPAPDIARASKVMGRVSEQLARASARAGSVNPDVV